jgi:hypothetical protein
MIPGARIPVLLRELADEVDALLAESPRPKRKPPERSAPKLRAVPTELQRHKAEGLLRAKGLAK